MASPKSPQRNLLHWTGFVGGPVAWALQLQAVYAFTPFVSEDRIILHVICFACLLLAVGSLLVAWRNWRGVGGWPSGSDEGVTARVRLMSVVGLMTGTFFVFVIVALWLAVLMLQPRPW